MNIIYKIEDCIHILSASSEALEKMTIEEIAAQAVPQGVKYFVVDGDSLPREPTEAWELSDDGRITVNQDKVAEIKRNQLTALTRRQFKLTLLENDLLQTVENAIAAIEDVKLRTRIQIEYTESEKFERSSESVKYMLSLIDLTDEQADEMWLQAMTF